MSARRWEVVRCWAGVGSYLVPQPVFRCWTLRGAEARASRCNAYNRIPGGWYDVRRVGSRDHDPRPVPEETP